MTTPGPAHPPAVEMRGVRVSFGPVVANDDVSFSVERGEIHALLGENGAGKTTLMRVLAGLQHPDAGEIRIAGDAVHIADPQTARRLGIGMVHQHFMLIDTMTVAENIVLGLKNVRPFFPRMGVAAKAIAALGEAHGLAVDPNAKVGTLSLASQQRVEILKALYRGAKVLVLDEPTAVLTPQESAALFPLLRSLAASGTSIVFISHKLNEVMAVTDHITVLQRGKVAGHLTTAQTNERQIARLMVGSDIARPQLAAHIGPARPPLLAAQGLTCRDERGVLRLDAVDLSIAPGEIVGVAGVDGNGQVELAEVIVGLRPMSAGRITLDGKDVTRAAVKARIAAGLAHIPEDRHRTAIVSTMSVADNTVIERLDDPRFSRWGLRRSAGISQEAETLVKRFDVRLGSVAQPIGSLSGGNQQKVVLGRALMRDPRIVVAVQPTRGLDIGATAFLQRQLLARRDAGAGVLLVSTELDEVMALSDRIVVMLKGRIVASFARADFSVERLGLAMAGAA